MTSLAELELALKHNRDIIKTSQDKMREAFIMEAFEYVAPWALNYDTPTQDAIQAHLNINMLIPLINIKGGNASFDKPETFPVQQQQKSCAMWQKKASSWSICSSKMTPMPPLC